MGVLSLAQLIDAIGVLGSVASIAGLVIALRTFREK